MSAFSQILKRSNYAKDMYLRNYGVVFKQDRKGILQSLFKVQIQRFRLQGSVTTNDISQQKTAALPKDSAISLVADKTKLSKAMKMYMERSAQHDKFMKTELQEYEIGKRHLANMMGEDPETFTQDDIDRAIEYLMPSGLYEPKARPLLKHPTKVFPKRKAAEFSVDGRPFHCLFYCARPNFYQVLHDISEHFIQLNKYEDTMTASGIFRPDISNKINVRGTRLLNKTELEEAIIEGLKDRNYEEFVTCMTRLIEHPYSSKVKDFIMKYRLPLVSAAMAMEIPPLKYDENKRPYMDAVGYRKRTVANVIVWGNGTGKLDINGRDITFFEEIQDREQLMFPLHFTGLLDKVDVEATVIGVGHTAQSGSIRHGMSLALRSFVSSQMVERMRLAGLITRDRRNRERKKPGQEGARRKFTWKKR